MEYSTWFYFTSIASFLIFLFLLTKLLQNQFPQKPSPPRLPIIGHLHLFRAPLMYRTLESLSKKYGPILPLRFGSRPVLSISSQRVVLQKRPRFRKQAARSVRRAPQLQLHNPGDYLVRGPLAQPPPHLDTGNAVRG